MDELKEKLIDIELDDYLALKKQLGDWKKNQYNKLTKKEKVIFDDFANMINAKVNGLNSQLSDLYQAAVDEAEFMNNYF